jgi:hypothetical protein
MSGGRSETARPLRSIFDPATQGCVREQFGSRFCLTVNCDLSIQPLRQIFNTVFECDGWLETEDAGGPCNIREAMTNIASAIFSLDLRLKSFFAEHRGYSFRNILNRVGTPLPMLNT